MATPIHYADQYQPDFGMPWSPMLPPEVLQRMSLPELERYEHDRKLAERLAEENPVACGWTLPTWQAVMENWKKYNIHVVLGGNQCVHGSTLIHNPVSNNRIRIKNLREPHYVNAWIGTRAVPTIASPSFCKGKEEMFHLRWKVGAPRLGAYKHWDIKCTAGHKMMDPDGNWVRVGDLKPGDRILGIHYLQERHCTIVAKDSIGEHEVWDFNVPDYGNYICNGAVHSNSGKTTLGARLTVWAAATIPQAETYCFHVSEKRSIDDQQRFIYEALPPGVKELPTKKGIHHSMTYSQKNGFTDGICILPPLEGYRRGGSINFFNYAQYAQNPQIIEGVKAHAVWCLAEGEMVQMADGSLKNIEDVIVGDQVLSINGMGRIQHRAVTAVQDRGEKDCLLVRPRIGTPVVCTPDHDLYWGYLLQNKERADEASRLAQIRPGWWPEKTKDRSDAWYVWAALVVSEGHIPGKKITSGWDKVIRKAEKLLPKGATLRCHHSPKAAVPDWFLKWPEFWDEFNPELRSETQEIPAWVFTSSKEKVRLFLRWLYHGDGWVYGHTVGYASTSRRLSTQIVILLNRLGIRATFFIRKSTRKNWQDQYWVSVSRASEVVKFLTEIGLEGKDKASAKVLAEAQRRVISKTECRAHLRTHGKCEQKWKDRALGDRTRVSRITDKIPFGKRRVYDITVEGEHRFFCGTGLVSNCDEKVPLALLDTLKYRLFTYHGRLLLTYTVIDGWNDTIEKILAKTKTLKSAYSEKLKRNLPIMQESLSMDSCIIYYAWTDHNPFTDAKEFWKLNASADEPTILARAYGIPTKSLASAFPLFSRDVNVLPHEELPFVKDPEYPVTRYMAIDPAGSKNWFMAWVAIDQGGTWYFYREWPDYDDWALPGNKAGPAQRGLGKGLKDYVELIKSMEAGEEIYERVIDPRMGAAERQTQDGATTIISDLDECDMLVIPAPGGSETSGKTEIEDGIQLINNLLAYDQTKPRDSVNTPKLFISDRCSNLIYAFQEYTGKLGQTEVTKDPVDTARFLRKNNCEFYGAIKPDTQNRTGVY